MLTHAYFQFEQMLDYDMKKILLDYLAEKTQAAMLQAAMHAGAWAAHQETAEFVATLSPDAGEKEEGSSPSNAEPPSTTEIADRVRTTRPTLDLLRRSAQPMTPAEVVAALRKEGFDVIPNSVRRALSNGVALGVLEKVGNRYMPAANLGKAGRRHSSDGKA